jgi:hypothetical protein
MIIYVVMEAERHVSVILATHWSQLPASRSHKSAVGKQLICEWTRLRATLDAIGICRFSSAGASDRAVWDEGLRPLVCWDCGFESRGGLRGAWKFVSCECCVLSGRGLCDQLITCTEEFYRLWCVVVCDLETSLKKGTWPALGPHRHKGEKRLSFSGIKPNPSVFQTVVDSLYVYCLHNSSSLDNT